MDLLTSSIASTRRGASAGRAFCSAARALHARDAPPSGSGGWLARGASGRTPSGTSRARCASAACWRSGGGHQRIDLHALGDGARVARRRARRDARAGSAVRRGVQDARGAGRAGETSTAEEAVAGAHRGAPPVRGPGPLRVSDYVAPLDAARADYDSRVRPAEAHISEKLRERRRAPAAVAATALGHHEAKPPTPPRSRCRCSAR